MSTIKVDTIKDETGAKTLVEQSGSNFTWGAGVPAGTVLQQVYVETTALVDCNVQIDHNDTIPQKTEGVEIFTLAITPKRSDSYLMIEVLALGSASVASRWIILSLFKDSEADATAATSTWIDSVHKTHNFGFRKRVTAGTAGVAETWKLRGGPNDNASSARLYINGPGGGRVFGGAACTSMTITEIKA